MTWVTLRRDLPTKIGTLAKGIPVRSSILSNRPGVTKICLDPPGPHLGKCHRVDVPTILLAMPTESDDG